MGIPVQKEFLLFCAIYCVPNVPRAQPEAAPCACLLRSTRICLCSVCNVHRDRLLIMLQARQPSTAEIMSCPAPARMSHTMARRKLKACLTLLLPAPLLPWPCQWSWEHGLLPVLKCLWESEMYLKVKRGLSGMFTASNTGS